MPKLICDPGACVAGSDEDLKPFIQTVAGIVKKAPPARLGTRGQAGERMSSETRKIAGIAA